ncbi:hypothetical protein JKP88DRAFT_246107 [Tribonema minus]|uniref:SET domain-containing protein n=1 Tax=Tribonema minus TaxID=303371 RepID=A0A835YUN6_9STRA|nr:hypothetical protein JKP88DRAFT_246107 [Tribonema minus]
MGRVLWATRSFAPGDLVMRERPLLVFVDGDGGHDLIDKALKMSEEDRLKLLDMYHLRPGDDPRFTIASYVKEQSEKKARTVVSARASWSAYRFAYEVISMAAFNSHDFATSSEQSLSGLFPLASLACHSCTANCTFTTANPSGVICYYAARSIAEGDPISILYDVRYAGMPTLQRWMVMAKGKDFVCQCSLCIGPDAMSGVKCLRCHEGVAMPTFPRLLPTTRELPTITDATWLCDSCGHAPEPYILAKQLSEADKLTTQVTNAAKHVRGDRPFSKSQASNLRRIATHAHKKLGGVHSVIMGTTELSWAAIKANSRNRGMNDTVYTTSIVNLVEQLSIMECAEAGCSNGTVRCKIEHSPSHNFDIVADALTCLMAITDLPKFVRLHGDEVAFLVRYLPLLALTSQEHKYLAFRVPLKMLQL